MATRKGYRINVANAKVAKITENTESSYILSDVKKLPGLRAIDFTPLLATGQLYGDGVLVEDAAMVTGGNVKIDANKIAIAERAMITGAEYKDGVLDIKTSDVPPEIALYVETEASNGTKEQMWFLCCKAQPFGISGTQRESNISYSTDSLTLSCFPRAKDKKVFRMADTEDETFTSEMSAKFAEHPDMAGATTTEQTTTP